MSVFNIFSTQKQKTSSVGLRKTQETFFSKITRAILGKSKVDKEVLDKWEEALLSSDVGVPTTLKIIAQIEKRVSSEKFPVTAEINTILREEITSLLAANAVSEINGLLSPLENLPYVIMVVGVNGVGKTTTIGKLAHRYRESGKSVILGAADTFRAAAVEQLMIWGKRTGAHVVTKGMNADPASVAFDTINSAVAKKADVAIIDTAGRLHTKVNLMEELAKIKRVMKKVIPDAPHEVLLVLDASIGQNAIEQARQFTAVTEVSAIALTKLDGTAKGGVIIGISDEFKIPVKYVGVGEKAEDLKIFNKFEFVNSLFNEKNSL